MQYYSFEDHELHFVQIWIRLNTEGSYAHVFKDSRNNCGDGEVAVESDAHETPIRATN